MTERMRTYRPEAIDSLAMEASACSTSFSTLGRPRVSIPMLLSEPPLLGSDSPSLEDRLAAQRLAKEKIQRAKEEEFKKKMDRKALEKKTIAEQEFQTMYSDVLGGLSNDSGVMGDTRYTLEHFEKMKKKKVHDLYDEWDAQVFSTIQDRLQTRVNDRTVKSIEGRLTTQMADYINTTNTKKLGLFRDVIVDSEYDPMTAHDYTIKVPVGDIRDPLKRDVMKPLYERTIMTSSLDSLPTMHSKTKPVLDTELWSSMKIMSTQYGHCSDATGSYVTRSMSPASFAKRKSRIPMDHYNYPQDAAAAAQEMGRIEKGTLAGKGKRDEGSQNFFGVMQNTCSQAPTVTGGDCFLELKGKGQVPSSVELRGNVGARETVQMTSDPYKDGKIGGDKWMEHKGKGMPPGPEQRKGRPNLTETFQMASNPYEDGRPLGDAWLLAKGKRNVPGAPDTAPAVLSMTGGPVDIHRGKVVFPGRAVDHLGTVGHQVTGKNDPYEGGHLW